MIRFWKKIQQKLKNTGQFEPDTEIKDDLQVRYKSFLDLLTENEHSLDLMTELENKYYNQQLISIPYLKSMIKNLSRRIRNILFDLQAVSGNDYKELFWVFEDISKKIREITTGSKDPIYTPVIIPMNKITTKFIDKVGSKMANLGELKNRCNMRIPDGFGLTVCAYTHFSEFNNLPEKIFDILHRTDVNKSHDLLAAEAEIKTLIKNAQVPSEIEEVILKQSAKIEKKHKKPIFWAVRSSAIGEDLEDSFAGQFSTILNVPTKQLIEKYKAVAASKYNTRSILYQRMKNIRSDDVNMSVGFLEMVNAKCSGVLYTTNPVHPDKNEIVISAIWGLGQLLVEGDISADTYILSRNT
jgi:pyruvate,water dikinase